MHEGETYQQVVARVKAMYESEEEGNAAVRRIRLKRPFSERQERERRLRELIENSPVGADIRYKGPNGR